MGKRKERTEREIALLKEPGTIDRIVDFVASGVGFLGSWCQVQDVRYHNVYGWVHADKDRLSKYTAALESRTARLQEKVEAKLELLIDADPRRAYDKDGKLKSPRSLPDDVAGAVAEISTGGRNGDKLKLVPPDRAVELAGRRLGLFREKVELEVTEGLGTRLDAARRRIAARK